MSKYHSKLIFTFITLIIVVLFGLGLLLGEIFKSYYSKAFDERMKKESRMLSIYLTDQGGLNNLSHDRMKQISDILGARVTITSQNGSMLADSQTEKVSDSTAFTNKLGERIKINPDTGEWIEQGNENNLHYYWSQIKRNGNTAGYVVVTAKTNELKNAVQQIWWILAICLGIVSILIILLGLKIKTRYTKPIASATTVAMELANGNYRARTSVEQMDEMGVLNSAINILARNLQEMVKAQEMQQDRLSVLIENIGAGLILFDSRGYISLINKGYKEIFGVNPNDYVNRVYYEVIEHQEVTRLVEEIFITEQKVSKQMVLPLSIERRYFDVYGVPIIGTNKVWKGVLLVFHDITDIKKLENMRKDFVANVSHELKTPVTSIKGFSETLLDGAMNDKKALEEFLTIILKESDRLQSLINDLLELSKIEQQDFKLNMHEFDILQTLKDVITLLSNKAAEKNIVIQLDCEIEKVLLKADMHRIKQVFINLIGNAIAYTPKSGSVTVMAEELKQTVQISVKDTGIGIEKSEISRIFERFYRVDRARSRNSGGTGLGLAIVKHIIEAHHGKIKVKSEPGKGSEFIIELPKQINENE